MANILTNHGYVIISATATPTSAEIAAQFSPKALKVNYESLASNDSGRMADGTMVINYLLKRIRKVQIDLKTCSPAEASAILSKVQGQVYYLTYFDPLANAEKTINVYTSQSAADCYSGILNTNGLYQGVSFNAIEIKGEA